VQGVDKKTTVLDYVVRSAFDKKEAKLLEWPQDLADVADVSIHTRTHNTYML
jgi:hypothetical protein